MQVMTTIDHFNLRSFDLNLLVAFDALIAEGNVTKAARRLENPTASDEPLACDFAHTLAGRVVHTRRTGHATYGTSPEARGSSSQALRQAQLALAGGDEFDPATELRTFRVAMSPEIELLLIPDLTARLRRLAPGIKILARVFPYEAMEPSLEDGSIDLAVGCTYTMTSRRSFEKLYETGVACCFNPDLLPLPNPVGLDDYLSAEHSTISQNETLQGCIKDALEIAGVDLNVVAAAPGYMSVLSAAQLSPVIATVPARIAERYGPLLGLKVSPMPVSLSFPPANMVWAKHADSDSANHWVRQQIRDSLASNGVVDERAVPPISNS